MQATARRINPLPAVRSIPRILALAWRKRTYLLRRTVEELIHRPRRLLAVELMLLGAVIGTGVGLVVSLWSRTEYQTMPDRIEANRFLAELAVYGVIAGIVATFLVPRSFSLGRVFRTLTLELMLLGTIVGVGAGLGVRLAFGSAYPLSPSMTARFEANAFLVEVIVYGILAGIGATFFFPRRWSPGR